MNDSRKTLIAALALATGALAASGANAASAAINAAKASCVIGERTDGYLGVVAGKTASPSLLREMREINQRRKQAYAGLASQQGVSIEATATVAAEKLINRAGPGECVQNAARQWIQR